MKFFILFYFLSLFEGASKLHFNKTNCTISVMKEAINELKVITDDLLITHADALFYKIQ
jgi:hypothetical protein